MGQQQSKESIAMAQTQAQIVNTNVENKINIFGIGLIVIVNVVLILLCYGIRMKCQQRVRGWLRKEITTANLSAPVVKVETVPMRLRPAQQPAAPASAQPPTHSYM